MRIVSTIERFGRSHEIIEHGGRYAYVEWDPVGGQVSSPNYGSGDHYAVFARGGSDQAYLAVAFLGGRSTAYARRRAVIRQIDGEF